MICCELRCRRHTTGVRSIRVCGTVQGVGFRPFVYRLARAHDLVGWVRNDDAGVEIHVEGAEHRVAAFLADLSPNAPPAAQIASIHVDPDDAALLTGFEIRHSALDRRPTPRISPDLPVCKCCLDELFDPANHRHQYAYLNCTNCGPRFSIVNALPYDRPQTTMAAWPMCAVCAAEYHDPDNRRFHAQPLACASCGPGYRLVAGAAPEIHDHDAIAAAARLLSEGRIVALKGIGGYHLACDAGNAHAVAELRTRKYRKDQASRSWSAISSRRKGWWIFRPTRRRC
ncbi:MAG TPA: acylphosphatase [Vicinamibacterales bacterium]|nr:acylphosphatase [Vicinamibacterales bacterium]